VLEKKQASKTFLSLREQCIQQGIIVIPMDDLVPTWLDQLLATDPQQQEGALRKLIYHSTRGINIINANN
jgi:hypothetical protein